MKLFRGTAFASDGDISARRRSLLAGVAVGFMLSSAACHAATFDWPTTPAWPGTGPVSGATQTVDYGYYANGSIRASVFNSGETYAAGYPSVQTSAAFPGANGGFSGQRNLILSTSTTASTASYSQITFSFMYTGGANNVSFNLYDIDWGGNSSWIDQISQISATAAAGGTVYATSVTGSTANSVTGSGSTYLVTGTGTSGNDSANGNVNVDFGATAITSLTFRWANTAPTARTTQNIGFSPISLTPIGTVFPEVNSSTAALALCGGIMGFGRFRRRPATRDSAAR